MQNPAIEAANSGRRPAAPQYKRRFVPGKTIVYMFLPQVEPPCTSRCTGCYVLASDSYQKRARRSEEQIISDLKRLTASGYSVIPSTTEILLNGRWPEMLSAVKTTYVLTNGKPLVSNPPVLGELARMGISQVVLTANFGNSGLSLPPRGTFQRAVELAIGSGLEVMARVTLTKENYAGIMEMVDACRQLGIRCVQFLRFLPVEKGPDMLDEEDAKRFFGLLALARGANPDTYISAGASLGSQFRRKPFSCPAGKTQFLIGLDNRIYPCIYLTQDENAVGRYEDGNIIIEREFTAGGNDLDCPAYRYFSTKK